MLSSSRVRFAIHIHGTDGLKVLDRLYIIRYLGAKKPELCTEICFNSLTQPSFFQFFQKQLCNLDLEFMSTPKTSWTL